MQLHFEVFVLYLYKGHNFHETLWYMKIKIHLYVGQNWPIDTSWELRTELELKEMVFQHGQDSPHEAGRRIRAFPYSTAKRWVRCYCKGRSIGDRDFFKALVHSMLRKIIVDDMRRWHVDKILNNIFLGRPGVTSTRAWDTYDFTY